MMNLEDRLVELITKYLFHECRSYNGLIERGKQVEFILKVMQIQDLSELFEDSDGNYSWKKNEYDSTLKSLVSNRSPEDLSRINSSRYSILRSVLTDTLKRNEEEAEERKAAYETQKLKRRIIDLEAQIEFGKPSEKVGFLDRVTSRVNIPYIIVLLLSVTLIAGLSLIGLTTTMTVNVDFNIGEIIGGLLVGVGVAAAGISYAANNEPRNSNDAEQ